MHSCTATHRRDVTVAARDLSRGGCHPAAGSDQPIRQSTGGSTHTSRAPAFGAAIGVENPRVVTAQTGLETGETAGLDGDSEPDLRRTPTCDSQAARGAVLRNPSQGHDRVAAVCFVKRRPRSLPSARGRSQETAKRSAKSTAPLGQASWQWTRTQPTAAATGGAPTEGLAAKPTQNQLATPRSFHLHVVVTHSIFQFVTVRDDASEDPVAASTNIDRATPPRACPRA
ncbi:hypothetical protein LIA77_02136 [Sarocladium implicatum]|nr:hypothetical protein LIA77_02136 [Sarocladium implicatum]